MTLYRDLKQSEKLGWNEKVLGKYGLRLVPRAIHVPEFQFWSIWIRSWKGCEMLRKVTLILLKKLLRRNLKRFSFQPRMKRNVDCVKSTRDRVLDDTNYSGSWSRLAPFPQNGPQKRNRQHFIKKSEKVVKRFSADVRFPIVSWNPRWHPEYVGISSKFRATSAQNLFISAQLFRLLKVSNPLFKTETVG